MRVAEKTIAAINQMLEADQGNAYRGYLAQVLPHIGDAYKQETDPWRSHLGASIMGRTCARQLYYSFRWATRKAFDGRMVRLFNRGHLEEGRFIAFLLMIGVQVYQQDAEGKQYRIDGCNGHYGGSGDGILVGIPDLENPQEPIIGEFKTHNRKSFEKLIETGVRKSKFEHWAQMQQYMTKMNHRHGLYLAACKDDDELHGEIVELETPAGPYFEKRAGDIINADKAPPRIANASPGLTTCKYCDHKGVCFDLEPPALNCRTCKHSRPVEIGMWSCAERHSTIMKQMQIEGCELWERFDDQ